MQTNKRKVSPLMDRFSPTGRWPSRSALSLRHFEKSLPNVTYRKNAPHNNLLPGMAIALPLEHMPYDSKEIFYMPISIWATLAKLFTIYPSIDFNLQCLSSIHILYTHIVNPTLLAVDRPVCNMWIDQLLSVHR